jgi:hypothetical protein
MLSPGAFNAAPHADGARPIPPKWGETHMIPPDRARAARIVRPPRDFDED